MTESSLSETEKVFDALARGQFEGEWRGSCPSCGYSNAFSLRARPGRVVRMYCFNACSQMELGAALANFTGKFCFPPALTSPAEDAAKRARRQEAAVALWNASVPIIGTIAQAYLASRGLLQLADSPALRFHGAASHPSGGSLPALVAQVVDPAGVAIGVHRTYLAANGCGKALVNPAKASLGPVGGGVIRLSEIAPGQPVVIGEGIETAASAGFLLGVSAWAAISAGNMGRTLRLPADLRELIIAVDPDPPGREAAWAASRRWRLEGRTVRFAEPNSTGDFNDVLCTQTKETIHV